MSEIKRLRPPTRSQMYPVTPYIPHTVWCQPPFALDDRLALFELPRRSASKSGRVVSEEEQIDQWNTCLASCRDPYNQLSGWTACFAGTHGISFAETAAAILVSAALTSKVPVAWVDLSEALRRKAYNPIDFSSVQGSEPFLTIVTGLRLDSPMFKYERAFELLRNGSANCNRVVVATGAIPTTIMTKIGLGAQRVLNFAPNTTTMVV